jgi:type IV pilus assembly protein PilB
MTAQNVVDMLVTRGVIDEGQADDLAQDVQRSGKDILSLLTDYGIYSTEDDFWAAVAEELGAEHFDFSTSLRPELVINSFLLAWPDSTEPSPSRWTHLASTLPLPIR